MGLLVTVAIALGGTTYRRNEDYRSELSIWSDAVAKRPANANARYALANVLASEGRAPEAIQQYQWVLQINPRHADALNNWANLLCQLDRHAEAIPLFRRALVLRPLHAPTHNNYANALAALDQREQASLHYRQALRLDPDYIEAHFNLAVHLSEEGKLASAAGEARRAFALAVAAQKETLARSIQAWSQTVLGQDLRD